eukprot:4407689-Pleurochrysis_carterae.AAC.1
MPSAGGASDFAVYRRQPDRSRVLEGRFRRACGNGYQNNVSVVSEAVAVQVTNFCAASIQVESA